MSKWGYQRGLDGEEEPSISEEKADWRAGMRARLANQDLARRIRGEYQSSSPQGESSGLSPRADKTVGLIAMGCMFALASFVGAGVLGFLLRLFVNEFVGTIVFILSLLIFAALGLKSLVDLSQEP
jgi:hypothetical protein